MEEEAKIQPPGGEHTASLDPDTLDIIFNLVDFPQTKAEALALTKYNMTVNCVMDVQQVMKKAETEEEAEDIQSQEVPQELEGQELEIQKKAKDKLDQLKLARAASIKNSPLRFMYIQAIEFVNMPQISYKTNETGEEIEERKEAELHFYSQLIQKLEHTGALLIKYKRFRDKVPLIPLMPDKNALLQIEQLKAESEDYELWVQDNEQVLNLNQSQKSIHDSNVDDQHSIGQRKQEYEQEKQQRLLEEQQRKQKINELKKSLKVSVDDVKDYSTFKTDLYNKDFIPAYETKNCISSIMSAMVSQIAKGEAQYTTTILSGDGDQTVDNEDTIDDLFDDFAQEISYDLQLEERPDTFKADDNYQKQASSPMRQRKTGAQAMVSQQTIIGQIDYHEESDKSKHPLFKVPGNFGEENHEKAEDICLREKAILEHLVLPGFNRHLMPQVPSKSQRIRDAEKPAIYPFCTLPIEDTERALIQKAFQDLLRSNFIDEGQSPDTKHAKHKAFERCFEQHMSPDILRQVLAEALLKEPDVSTLYYPRNDSLLVAFYNKIKGIQKQEDDYHGEREWKAAYRVLPDFENWVKFFSEDLIVPLAASNKDSTAHLQRYQLDEEMIPDQMLDIDDSRVQNLSEKSKMFYPEDGSLMKLDTFTVGGEVYNKSVVYKDNLVFGLRKTEPEQPVTESEQEYNFYAIKKTGAAEFWLNFENDTKLLVEQFKYEKNPQRLIRIDPPKPTPEEIAAREEAIKQAQALAAKQKNKPGAQAQPLIEEYKEPEPTYEPEPLDFLDTYIDQAYTHYGETIAQTTVTLQNGLIVRFTEHGDIVQLTEDQLFDKSIEEKDRIVKSESGVVIRQFRNRDAEALFPNGQVAHFSKEKMMWTVTNNKGRRVAKKGGVSWDLDPIPCAAETDAVSNAKMMIREDKVLTIQFKDGSLYCQHADGTLMKTSADGNQIRIEKEGYAPVIVYRGLRKIETVDEDVAEEQMILVNPKERALKGWLMETHLPDGTIVESFHDVLHNRQDSVRHLFNRPDFTLVSVDAFGSIDIISSNCRGAMNENSGRRLMGQDTDFAKALYNDFSSYLNFGTYHAYLQDRQYGEAAVFTVTEELTQFYKITRDLDLVKSPHSYFDGSEAPDPIANYDFRSNLMGSSDNGPEYEEVGGHKDPLTKNFIHPRLFVINSDGSGYELLTKQQLEYYFRIAKHREECIKQRTNVMIGNTLAKTHYFMSRVKNMYNFQVENQLLKTLDFPQNSQYALFHNKEIAARLNQTQAQHPHQYVFRQIFEFQEFEVYKQEAFYDDFNRYKQWKMSQIRYDTEFGIVHVPAKDQVLDYKKIEDDEFFAKRIATRIMKERRKVRAKFDPDFFKKQFIAGANQNQELTEYYRKGTGNNDTGSQWRVLNSGNIDVINSGNFDKQSQLQQLQESVNMDKIKVIKKKQEQNIQNQLSDIRRMINTPTFMPAYFSSKEGQVFTKNNPQKPPSQEMIMRMSQRINRSQQNTEKGQSQYDPNQSQKGDQLSPNNNNNQDQLLEGGEDREGPIVALEPEDHYNKQGSNFMGSKKLAQNDGSGGGPQPSLYIQEKLYFKQKEQEQLLKAEEYHVVKTKDFNVIGRLRQEKPFVKSIAKSQVQTELNEKFITTECIADRRVKISSMAQRQFINAPSIEDVRKQGQHQMILSAINKKQTFAELINQANSMVTSVLHDPLKRSVNIMPSQLQFGTLQASAGPYELTLTIKNEDSIAQRVTIRPLIDKKLQFNQEKTGLIAPGMTRVIKVVVQSQEECSVRDTLQIVTKSDIYKVPIEAKFLSPENYQKEYQEQRAVSGKGLANSRVRNKLNDSIQKGRMSAQGDRLGGASIDGGGSDGEGQGRQPWMETTNSDSRLPQIPKAQRPFEVDPKKPLKDLLKKQ